MLPFELTILGSSSATPTSTRNPSAQALSLHDRLFLIDCGEATQIQIRRFRIKIQRIERIFISHLHGDHYLGLPGLLGTMHLLGREKDLHIHAPLGLKEIIELNNRHSKTFLRFSIHFHEIDETTDEIIFEDEKITVSLLKMDHRIPCYGFLFREKPYPRNILKEKADLYKIPFNEFAFLKKGNDYINADGTVIPNHELTTAPPPPRTFAYCSDTAFTKNYLDKIHGADLLYHEATFSEEQADRAVETYHCTARQAGTIAFEAGVKKLVIGHYSARYRTLDHLLSEAKDVFENTILAQEGEIISII